MVEKSQTTKNKNFLKFSSFTMQILSEHSQNALTVNQLLAEIQVAKDAGYLTGNEKVILGTGFMRNCWPVCSVAVSENLNGEMSMGMSSEPEKDWAVAFGADIEHHEVAIQNKKKSAAP